MFVGLQKTKKNCTKKKKFKQSEWSKLLEKENEMGNQITKTARPVDAKSWNFIQVVPPKPKIILQPTPT